MALAGLPILITWFLFIAGAGWVMAKGLLHRTRQHREMGEYHYCAYCSWPADRSGLCGPVRWQGRVYCGLVCLRRDAELLVQEGRRE